MTQRDEVSVRKRNKNIEHLKKAQHMLNKGASELEG
jgi:hypothetical protein